MEADISSTPASSEIKHDLCSGSNLLNMKVWQQMMNFCYYINEFGIYPFRRSW